MIRVGDTVFCTATQWHSTCPPERTPLKGHVYTVKSVVEGRTPSGVACPSGRWLTLEGFQYDCYCSSEFRPARTNRNLYTLRSCLVVGPMEKQVLTHFDNLLALREALGEVKRHHAI